MGYESGEAMTKRWSSTKSLDGQTKRQASKSTRREIMKEDMENLMNSLADIGLEHPDLIDETEAS